MEKDGVRVRVEEGGGVEVVWDGCSDEGRVSGGDEEIGGNKRVVVVVGGGVGEERQREVQRWGEGR